MTAVTPPERRAELREIASGLLSRQTNGSLEVGVPAQELIDLLDAADERDHDYSEAADYHKRALKLRRRARAIEHGDGP